jgi:hypothetical protein
VFIGDLIGNEGPILVDARTLVSLPGVTDMNYEGEFVILATSNVADSTATWTASRDGFVLGWRANLSSGFAIALNADPPHVVGNPTAGTVLTGVIAYVGATVNSQLMQSAMMIPFKLNDVIKIKTGSASQLVVELYLGYAKIPTQK